MTFRSKSHLSVKQAELLQPFISGLTKLDSGQLVPKTPGQENFVAVCRGKRMPETEYEKAYLAWRRDKPDLRTILVKAERARTRAKELEGSSHKLSDQTLGLLGRKVIDRGLPKLASQDELVRAEKERQERATEKQGASSKKSDFKRQKMVETWDDREAWKRDSSLNKFNGQ